MGNNFTTDYQLWPFFMNPLTELRINRDHLAIHTDPFFEFNTIVGRTSFFRKDPLCDYYEFGYDNYFNLFGYFIEYFYFLEFIKIKLYVYLSIKEVNCDYHGIKLLKVLIIMLVFLLKFIKGLIGVIFRRSKYKFVILPTNNGGHNPIYVNFVNNYYKVCSTGGYNFIKRKRY